MNEYYGSPTTPTSDYLMHYGVKGMKWGVRKAIASGNSARLGRQYRKAQRKLAKLEKRAASGKKYARRAAALGAGAAVAGGLAAAGTLPVAKAIGRSGAAFSKGAKGAGGLITRVGEKMTANGIRGGGRVAAVGTAVSGLGKHNASGVAQRVAEWGGRHGAGERLNALGQRAVGSQRLSGVTGRVNQALAKTGHADLSTQVGKLKNISNSGYARIGAAGLGAGMAAGAAYNAYRAATTKRAARKAAEFRREMNKSFAGTQYANAPRTPKKRRRG